MRRYLFIGGPRDGQWHGVRYHLDAPAHPYLVPDPDIFASRKHWRYYRRTVMVPGWLIPLDVYVLDGLTEIDRNVILPGYAYRRSHDHWPVDTLAAYRMRDGLDLDALRDAVTTFNRERLSR